MRWWPCLVQRWIAVGLALLGLSIAASSAQAFHWIHAPFGVRDFDGPAKPPQRFGRLIFNRVGVYPGSLGNYSGLHKKNIPIITIELPNAGTTAASGAGYPLSVLISGQIVNNFYAGHSILQEC